jgi:hypothetical protein
LTLLAKMGWYSSLWGVKPALGRWRTRCRRKVTGVEAPDVANATLDVPTDVFEGAFWV